MDYYTKNTRFVKMEFSGGYLKSDVGFFCFRVFEKGGCSKVLCGIFSFRAVRRKAVAVKFYVGFLIKSDLCRKRHRHLTEDAGAFLLECSGNQLNNSSSFCGSVPSLAYGSASNCRKLCLMSPPYHYAWLRGICPVMPEVVLDVLRILIKAKDV